MDLTKAVIHHTAGRPETDRDLTVDEVDAMHKKRTYVDRNGKTYFWKGIGYHFLIRKDGSVHAGRPLTKRGAHAKGRNHCIGIALTGYEYFTLQQYSSLLNLLKELGVKHVERHHEECPGVGLSVEGIQEWLNGE